MPGPFWLRRPSTARLGELVADQAGAALTYPEVGATAGEPPPGYHHVDRAAVLGHGDGTFEAAVEGIRTWAPHRGAGLSVHPDGPPAAGATVVVLARVGPLWTTAACRVVEVVDEPDRYGFAYGTLPVHPEVGEERFLVERGADGQVVFRIVAFSRPGHTLTRLGGPVGRRVQDRVTRRYLAGVLRP